LATESDPSAPIIEADPTAPITRPLTDDTLDDQLVWALVEAAPDGIVVADDDGRVVLVNHRTEELFGYDRGDLLGKSVDELLPRRLRSAHRAHRTRYRAEPRTRSMGAGSDLSGLRRDGTEFPIEISLSPLRADGAVRVIATVRDISDRVAAEAAARRIRHTLDAIDDGVFIFDPGSLRFSYVNQGAVAQVGYTRDELLTMTPLHLNPVLGDDEWRTLLQPLLDGAVTSLTLMTVHRRRDGTDVPVEVLVQFPPGAPGERPMVALVRDVTERIKGQRDLRESEARLRTLYRVASEQRLGSPEQFTEMLRAASSLLGTELGVVSRIDGHRWVVDHVWSPELPLTTTDGFELEETYCSLVVEQADLVAIDHMSRSRYAGLPCVGLFRLESYLGAPIEVDGELYGTVAFASRRPRPEPWSQADQDFLRLLGTWVGRTIERNLTDAELFDARRSLAITEDRERIARDLHDTVIQRLFAAGMNLQGSVGRIDDVETRGRLEATVDELDETIREIRSAIFGLQSPTDGGPGLRGEVIRLTGELHSTLGFAPRVQFAGAIESIAPTVAEHLIPTLREALTNVAKHAGATDVQVLLLVDDEVLLRVIDNGSGLPTTHRGGNGLQNLTDRARRLGGSCTALRGPTGGTVIEWRVPAEPGDLRP